MPSGTSMAGDQISASIQEKKPQTCDTCKIRHQKCDSVRPTCHHCKLRGLECKYSTFSAKSSKFGTNAPSGSKRSKRPGGTAEYVPTKEGNKSGSQGQVSDAIRQAAMIREVLTVEMDALRLPKQQKENLISTLTEKLTRIASESTLTLRPPIDTVPTPVAEASSQSLLSSLSQIAASNGGQYSSTILESSPPETSPPSLSAPVVMASNLSYAAKSDLPNSNDAQTWVENFFKGPNQLFMLVSMHDGQSLFEKCYFKPEPLSERELCILTFILAAGARYTDLVACEIYQHWAYVARCRLETCISTVTGCQIWVLQPILLSCLSVLHSEPSTCWFTLGTAIYVAQMYGLDQEYSVATPLSSKEYEDHRGLWETILFLDVYLATKLGRLPMVNGPTIGLYDLNVSLKNPGIGAATSSSLAQLAVIIGKFLREVHEPVEKPAVSVYESYIRMLDRWALQLPQPLQFHDHKSNSDGETDTGVTDEIASRYFQLLYLDARMVLTQPLILERGASFWSGSALTPNSHSLVEISTHAALDVGHVSLDIAKHGGITKRFWLVVTINYRAALSLLMSLWMLRHDVPTDEVPRQSLFQSRKIHKAVETTLNVLRYCAQHDELAQRHLEVVQSLWDEFQSLSQTTAAGGFAGLQLMPNLTTTFGSGINPAPLYSNNAVQASVMGESLASSDPYYNPTPFNDPALSATSDPRTTPITATGPSPSFHNILQSHASHASPVTANPPGGFYPQYPAFHAWQTSDTPDQYPHGYAQGNRDPS